MTFKETTKHFDNRVKALERRIGRLRYLEGIANQFFIACKPFQKELEALLTDRIHVMRLLNQEDLGQRLTLVGDEKAIRELLTDRLGLSFDRFSKSGDQFCWYAKRPYALWKGCRVYATTNFKANYNWLPPDSDESKED